MIVIHEDSTEEIDINTDSNGYVSKIVGEWPTFFGCWSNDTEGVYLMGPSKKTFKMDESFLRTLLPSREEGYEDIYGPLVLTKLVHRNSIGEECNDPIDFGNEEYSAWLKK